jgi:hypothetical protein
MDIQALIQLYVLQRRIRLVPPDFEQEHGKPDTWRKLARLKQTQQHGWDWIEVRQAQTLPHSPILRTLRIGSIYS